MFVGIPNWHCWVAGNVFSIQKYWRYACLTEGIYQIACEQPAVSSQPGERQELLLQEVGQQGQPRTAEALW